MKRHDCDIAANAAKTFFSERVFPRKRIERQALPFACAAMLIATPEAISGLSKITLPDSYVAVIRFISSFSHIATHSPLPLFKNGIEVLEKLKADERTRATPVVMLPSSKEDPDIQKCYKQGADSYIVKPVNFEGFAQAIKNLGFYWLLLNQPPA